MREGHTHTERNPHQFRELYTACMEQELLVLHVASLYSSYSLVHYYYAVQSTVATSLTQCVCVCVCVCDMSSLIVCVLQTETHEKKTESSHLPQPSPQQQRKVHACSCIYTCTYHLHACGQFDTLLT